MMHDNDSVVVDICPSLYSLCPSVAYL